MTPKKAVAEIFEEHICFTADDVNEFFDALDAMGFTIVATKRPLGPTRASDKRDRLND